MDDKVSDLTIEVLKDIRAELRSLNGRVDALAERVDSGFASVNQRLDSVLKIVGTHHAQLESRVRRIEDHLGLE
jgi:hypothetical protein